MKTVPFELARAFASILVVVTLGLGTVGFEASESYKSSESVEIELEEEVACRHAESEPRVEYRRRNRSSFIARKTSTTNGFTRSTPSRSYSSYHFHNGFGGELTT